MPDPLCVPTRTAWLTCPIDLKLIKSCHKRPTKIIEVSFKLVVVYVAWRFLWSFLSYKLVVRQDDNFDRTLRGFLTVLLWWRRPKQRSQPVKTAPETPSFFERGWGAGSQRAPEPPPGWFQQTSPSNIWGQWCRNNMEPNFCHPGSWKTQKRHRPQLRAGDGWGKTWEKLHTQKIHVHV